ncbi:MAG: ATP-dependent RNA helicase HrpA [Methylococcales symbiont of Iophon sp. n. MRB-2018]|nr:MAG: ATP-dependent RNA helicase HrpA [Methylococcales symbiont of Iophon sp. n. MRB-2018]KAF3979235.1 MAG: ATP-dependent RNA helicase HrpA [Methylococcales symbiont of Iophon sp. n. MRB-2018]
MPNLSIIKQLSKQLNGCINVDKYQYKRQLDRLRNESEKGQSVESKLADLSQKIEVSIGKWQKRKDSIPAINYADLPVTDKKDEIADLIQQNQVLILCGETGSGKTTQLPKICLQIGRGVAGFIGHTQPRRIAARTVADRIAEELGQTIGQSVGYKVRFHDKTNDKSLVKLMTDGILLAESQNDPYLTQYDTLIIDEAHERSLNIDFLLGYLRWLLPKRPDLKLIITSATIDPERFSKHFNNAPIINVSGRTYPVEMRYRPIELMEEDDETSADLQQAIIDAVDELHRDIPGDILIFLNGEREIRETSESLRKHNPKNCEILPLYSKLSVSEQEYVFKPKGKMRIVLATNVAETSLTVPGIRSVIDIGHARISRYSHRSKIQRLPIEKISQASANQRAGRCGRVAKGICIRLYSEEDYLARAEFTEPEILRTNLSSVILQMMSLKLGDIEDFPFVDAPISKMILDGKKSLQEVNALDKEGKLTAVGRQLAKIPTDPKLARMLLAANQLNCLTEVSIIVSALSIQDPREKPADKRQQADSKHAQFKVDNSDFLTLLNIWNVFTIQKKELSNNQLRKYCKAQFLSYIRMREWFDIHSQVMQVIKGELKFKANNSAANYKAIHCALLPGLLSNIGFRHQQYQYLGARNLRFFIFPGSGQHKAKPKWIMAAEQVETSKVYARTVAKIDPEWIEKSAQHLIKSIYYESHWEKKAGRSAIYERTLLYGLTLQPKRKIPYERIDPKAAREIFIRSGLVAQDYQSNAPFFNANKKLLEEVGYIQHKGRRVDLIEDEEWLYQFYHKKLPEQVVNGITLDKWRKTVEKESPKILFLSKQDLTRQEDETVSDRDYPDHKMVGNLSIKLQYRFEPGHDEDGVTAIIPVHQLNQISTPVFEWLVPGLLEEKVIALLKGLPKQVRKHFVPVSDTAKACLEIEPEMKASLYDWLGMRLRKLTGEAIALTQWNRESLADHLKMNYRVVDDKGHALDYGRKLKVLQEKYTTKAGDSFNKIAADELNHTGCIQWVFDDLPESYAFVQKGQSFIGFPAIIDEGDAVGVRIFDTRIKAQQAHYNGLVRLFQSVTRKESKYVLKNLAKTDTTELQYNRLPSHAYIKNRTGENFREDILFNMVATVFLQEGDIRSQLQFDECLKDNKQYMFAIANDVEKIVVRIIDRVIPIKNSLSRPNIDKELFDDITEQMNCLVYTGFIRYTSYDQLKSIPRYLKAIEYRIDKQKNDPQNRQILNHYWKRFWQEVEKQSTKQNVIPEQDKFRWDLEELRVSLFAQQLKTAYPISAKRLDKAWDERI